MTLQQYHESTFNIQQIPGIKSLSDEDIVSLKTNSVSFHFPVSITFETNELINFYAKIKSTQSLNPEIIKKIESLLGLTYTKKKEMPAEGEVCFANSPEVRPEFRLTFATKDIFDYIYAVLHSADYRENYKEFLESDGPRVPYPKDCTTFWRLVKLGDELRQIHLSALTETDRIRKEIEKVVE